MLYVPGSASSHVFLTQQNSFALVVQFIIQRFDTYY